MKLLAKLAHRWTWKLDLRNFPFLGNLPLPLPRRANTQIPKLIDPAHWGLDKCHRNSHHCPLSRCRKFPPQPTRRQRASHLPVAYLPLEVQRSLSLNDAARKLLQ